MKHIIYALFILSAFITNAHAETTIKTLSIECDNGVNATLNTEEMNVSGRVILKFEKVEYQDNEKMVIVYNNPRNEAKILLYYIAQTAFIEVGKKWVPCNLYRAYP